MFRALLKDESGATAIEYSLIMAMVAVAAMSGMRFLGTSLGSLFTSVGNTLTSSP